MLVPLSGLLPKSRSSCLRRRAHQRSLARVKGNSDLRRSPCQVELLNSAPPPVILPRRERRHDHDWKGMHPECQTDNAEHSAGCRARRFRWWGVLPLFLGRARLICQEVKCFFRAGLETHALRAFKMSHRDHTMIGASIGIRASGWCGTIRGVKCHEGRDEAGALLR